MTAVTGPTGSPYTPSFNLDTASVGGAQGVDTVQGSGGQPVVVDGAPPAPGKKNTPVQADGLPPPRMDRAEARAQFAKISSELDQFDLSQPMDQSSLAQVIALRDQLAAMFLKLRSADLKNRDDELQNMVSQRLAGVEKGLEAAKKQLTADLIGGFVQIAAGGLSMAGGMKGLKAAGSTGLTAGVDATATAGAKIQAMNQAFSGAGTMVQGTGSVVSSFFSYGAKEDDAAKAKLDLGADTSNTRMSQASERANNWLEQLKSFVQSQSQQMSETAGAFMRIFN